MSKAKVKPNVQTDKALIVEKLLITDTANSSNKLSVYKTDILDHLAEYQKTKAVTLKVNDSELNFSFPIPKQGSKLNFFSLLVHDYKYAILKESKVNVCFPTNVLVKDKKYAERYGIENDKKGLKHIIFYRTVVKFQFIIETDKFYILKLKKAKNVLFINKTEFNKLDKNSLIELERIN